MFNWLRELKEIWHTKAECQSCEILKLELSKERLEKQRLLDHLLTPKLPEPERLVAPEPQPIGPRHIPWKVKQQQLEEDDRNKARQVLAEFRAKEAAARNANPVPVNITPAITIEDLEANLGIVQEK